MNIISFNKNIIYIIVKFLKIQDQRAFYITCHTLYKISPYVSHPKGIYLHEYIKTSCKDFLKYEFTNLRFLELTDFDKNLILPENLVGFKGKFSSKYKLPNLQCLCDTDITNSYKIKNNMTNIEIYSVIINGQDLVIKKIFCHSLLIKPNSYNITLDYVDAFDVTFNGKWKSVNVGSIICRQIFIDEEMYGTIKKLKCHYIRFSSNITIKNMTMKYLSLFSSHYKHMKFYNANIKFYGFNDIKFDESCFINCTYRYC